MQKKERLITDISIHALRVEGDRGFYFILRRLPISIHALRVEGDAIGTGLLEQHSYISIHALRVEGDIINTAFDATQSVFLSTPSGWRATWQLRQAGNACEFLSTPSGWRATRASHSCKGSARYFYPRPPGGGRPASARIKKEPSDFYPRPPGGGRPIDVSVTNPLFRFLSTPSGWRATAKRALGLSKTPHFYPRPPGGGRLVRCSLLTSTWAISIHALRVEGDRSVKSGSSSCEIFLSTPSGWRATCTRARF